MTESNKVEINPETAISKIVSKPTAELLEASGYTTHADLKLAIGDGSFKITSKKKHGPNVLNEIIALVGITSALRQMVDKAKAMEYDKTKLKVDLLVKANNDMKKNIETHKQNMQKEYDVMVSEKDLKIKELVDGVYSEKEIQKSLKAQQSSEAKATAWQLAHEELSVQYNSLEMAKDRAMALRRDFMDQNTRLTCANELIEDAVETQKKFTLWLFIITFLVCVAISLVKNYLGDFLWVYFLAAISISFIINLINNNSKHGKEGANNNQQDSSN